MFIQKTEEFCRGFMEGFDSLGDDTELCDSILLRNGMPYPIIRKCRAEFEAYYDKEIAELRAILNNKKPKKKKKAENSKPAGKPPVKKKDEKILAFHRN